MGTVMRGIAHCHLEKVGHLNLLDIYSQRIAEID